jgi:hypothetical protein
MQIFRIASASRPYWYTIAFYFTIFLSEIQASSVFPAFRAEKAADLLKKMRLRLLFPASSIELIGAFGIII